MNSTWPPIPVTAKPVATPGTLVRTWLDRILELPWNTRTEDQLDLDQARAVLDADHYGLEEVKDRIVEYLAAGGDCCEVWRSLPARRAAHA